MPSTWSWQVILGFLSKSQRRRARWCASCGAPTTPSRPVPFARFASPSAACSSAISLRARTGVLASSFILEAGGFDSPLAFPSGHNYSAHRAASATSLVSAATLEPPLAHAPLPHFQRVLFAISSRRLLILSSSAHDDLGLSRHLRRNVHTLASAHIAHGRERRDRERATCRFCAR